MKLDYCPSGRGVQALTQPIVCDAQDSIGDEQQENKRQKTVIHRQRS